MLNNRLIKRPLHIGLEVPKLKDLPSKESLASAKEDKDPLSRYEKELLGASSAQSGVKEKIEGYIDSLEEKYDAFLDKLSSESYKDHNAYNEIVAGYTELGEKMAYDASASAAASNSGNFDSLGAANAHRQMISYKNAGENAAREAYNDSISAYADGLKDYSSGTGDAYSLLSQSAERKDDFTLSLIDDYANYHKLHDDMLNKLKKENEAEGDSDKLEYDALRQRVDNYVSLLMTVYPEYAEELERLFYEDVKDKA